MAIDLIAEANKRRIAAEQRMQQLRDEIGRMEAELSKLQLFLDVASQLSGEQSGNGATAPAAEPLAEGLWTTGQVWTAGEAYNTVHTGGTVKVRENAWVGAIAKYLLANGPQTLPDIVRATRNGARPDMPEADFITHMNSAIWRRKDLFKKENGRIDLVTRDIEFLKG